MEGRGVCNNSRPFSWGFSQLLGSAAGGLNGIKDQLDEDITEVQWSGCKSCFERWQLSYNISNKAVENRIFEAIPNTLADKICVGLIGTESKADLLAKIKDTVIKKQSVFLYCKDLHQIVQNRSEAPERYAARIRQAAPPCCLQTDNKTSDYSADLML
jgi:hypothetical protein